MKIRNSITGNRTGIMLGNLFKEEKRYGYES